eukprot:CAMPEP_0172358208 /NCGR_PEP_ID=MMETSP1060-20121228/2536_1 /TAXON_ID=37318 /ORGANISM="Pseudo-nitzschia pungens, Strain cf. cingulata" /LENGTH=653 /DNA_ID=CAMNT_0013079303 /DNA_START=178 /DNA_END=2141 /DNA_ORIENTATION=-
MTTAKPSENDESLPPKLLDLSLSSLTSASTSASTGLATVDDALTKQSNNDDKELEVEVQVEEALLRADWNDNCGGWRWSGASGRRTWRNHSWFPTIRSPLACHRPGCFGWDPYIPRVSRGDFFGCVPSMLFCAVLCSSVLCSSVLGGLPLVTVAELPSGILSDRWGRKATLVGAFLGLGGSLAVTAMALMVHLHGHKGMVWACLGLAQALRAVGSSLYSGTDMAFLYEVLQNYPRKGNKDGETKTENSSKEPMLLSIESRNVFATTVTEACVAAAGGWLSSALGLPAVIGLAAVPFLGGAIVAGCCLQLTGEGSPPNRRKGADGNADTPKPDPAKTKDSTLSTNNNSNNNNNNNNNSPQSTPVKLPTIERRTLFVTLPSMLDSSFRRWRRYLRLEFLRECVPCRVRTLFAVGVALNCGTYVAATALNPLLWETVGIPVGSFGTLHAGCGAATAVGALLAPTLRRWLSAVPSRNTKSRISSSTNSTTAALLVCLLGSSALAYGLMALATKIHIHHYHSSRSVPAVGCAMLAALLLSMVRGLAWPVLGAAINASVEHNGSRATTLSLFSGAIKIGMVLTGMALGGLFHHGSSTRDDDDDDDEYSLERGLMHGSILCGTTLVSIAMWLITCGLSNTDDTVEEKKEKGYDTTKSKSD